MSTIMRTEGSASVTRDLGFDGVAERDVLAAVSGADAEDDGIESEPGLFERELHHGSRGGFG